MKEVTITFTCESRHTDEELRNYIINDIRNMVDIPWVKNATLEEIYKDSVIVTVK